MEQKKAVQCERRAHRRSLAMFKAAYVEHNGRLSLVTLKDISSAGVCFAGNLKVEVGENVTFCVNDGTHRGGEIAWVKDGRFGVKVKEGERIDTIPSIEGRPRSVRLPVTGKVALYTGPEEIVSVLHNVSLRGTCVTNPGILRQGQLISLNVSGQNFEMATVKWADDQRAGICFAQPMGAPILNTILDKLQNDQYALQSQDETFAFVSGAPSAQRRLAPRSTDAFAPSCEPCREALHPALEACNKGLSVNPPVF